MTLKVRKADIGDFTEVINSNICCFSENFLKERNQKPFVHFQNQTFIQCRNAKSYEYVLN